MINFVKICSNLTQAIVNKCGTITNKVVDFTVGAYVLNNENLHTEVVWDIINASIAGTLQTSISNTSITITPSVTFNNDVLERYIFDWGVGTTTETNIFNYLNHADGSYSVNVYAVMLSGNVKSLGSCVITKTGNSIVITSPFTQVNRSYSVISNNCSFFQNYCDITPVGSPYNPQGNTPQGTISSCKPLVKNELLNTDDQEISWNVVKGIEIQEVTLSQNSVFTVTTGTTRTLLYTNPDLNNFLTPTVAGYINAVFIDWGDGVQEYIPSSDFGVSKFHKLLSIEDGNYEARIFIQTVDGDWHIYGQYIFDMNDVSGAITTVTPPVTYNVLMYRKVRNLIQHRLYDGTGLYFYNGMPATLSPGNIFDCDKKMGPNQVTSGIKFSNGNVSNNTQLATLGSTTPAYNSTRLYVTANTIPPVATIASPTNTREITVQNMTSSDIIVDTNQGSQTVIARNSITISNPNTLDINHIPFSGNITVTYLHNVGSAINGVQPRVALNFKSY